MKHISLPKKFTVEELVKGKKAKVIIEPCFPGYGLTLGNALRRVLLSSLAGGAVTAVKIKGAQHEFSTIENVSEDIVDIILNLKNLRFKIHSDESVTLKLKAQGEKEVTGADIETSSDAEVINKDCHLATLNDINSELEMEIFVAKGIGYVPTEERIDAKEKGEIGLILVDSIFTPVVNVGFDVEATRVGQKTDYDKIILDIETDGTISPEGAVKEAAKILRAQFEWIQEGGQAVLTEEVPIAGEETLKIISEESIKESAAVEEAEPVELAPVESLAKPKKRGRPRKVDKLIS